MELNSGEPSYEIVSTLATMIRVIRCVASAKHSARIIPTSTFND